MYFRNFPVIDYIFGSSSSSVRFRNLGAYVDVVDQVRSRAEFYTPYYIGDDERPDTLSYRLYGTSDYYWSFFLMNDRLRLSGWPYATYQSEIINRKLYPNTTLVTRDLNQLYTRFNVGDTVSLSTGEVTDIVSRNLDLGQITVRGSVGDTSGGYALISGTTNVLPIESSSPQYQATHHYEDQSGTWVDIDPRNPSLSGLFPITYQEYTDRHNEELRQIRVIKPDSIRAIVNEFNRKLAN